MSAAATTNDTDYYLKQQQLQHNDLSILRKPINTSVTGFLEVKKAYDDGTDEIRKLLGSECDIIYECKVCRNIFRSLTNFISHKRIYCRTYFNSSQHFHFRKNGFIDQDVTTIIQAEQDYTSTTSLSAASCASTAINSRDNKIDDCNMFNSNLVNTNNNINGNNKDLSGIIERLMKKQELNSLIKLTDFYDQVNHKLTQDEILQKNHIMQLDKIKNNKNAVYQSVSYDNYNNLKNNINNNDENINNNNTCNSKNLCDNNLIKCEEDNIKKEVNEIYDLLNRNNTVLGPDGKIITMVKKDNLPIIEMPDSDNLLENFTICKICDLKFATEKMLKLHIKTKHIPSTYVYPCPSCSKSFLQPSAVIRHLNNDHKKSMKRIRTMRDAIYKRRTRIDEMQIKGPSRELIRLQSTSLIKEKLDNDNNKEWMENMGNYNNTPMCTYCGKKFDRKAVLTTHLNNCQQKTNKNNKINNKNKVAEQLLLHHIDDKVTTTTTTTSTTLINDEKINVNNNNNNTSNIKTNDIDLDDNSNSYDSISADLVTIPTSSALTSNNNNNNNKNNNKGIIQSNFHSKLNDYNDSLEININDACIGGGGGGSGNNKSEEKINLVNNNNSKNISELTNVNKRKRRKAIKLDAIGTPDGINEFNAMDDEIYWTIDDKGILSVNSDNEKMKLSTAPVAESSSSSSLIDQQQQQQQKSNIKLICDFCDKKFVTVNNLKRHVTMYHSAKKFSCKLCMHRDVKKFDIVEHLSKVHSIMGDKNIVNKFIILLKTTDDPKRITPTGDNNDDDEEEDSNSVVSSNSCDNNTITVPHSKSSSGSKPSSSSSLSSANTVISTITSSNDNEHDTDKVIMKYDENESTSNSSFADNENNMNSIKRRGRPRGSKNSPQIRISQTTTRTSSKLDERQFDEICNNLTNSSVAAAVIPVAAATTTSSAKSQTTSTKSAVNATSSTKLSLSDSKSDRLYKSLKLPMSTLNSSHIKGDHIGKRPIRNRVKPVNKDFVYDLSNLLKKEAEVYKDQQAAVIAAFKQQKRKSIIQQQLQQQQQQQQQQNFTTHQILSSDENSCNDDIIDVFADNKYNLKCVGGAAFAMAYAEVRLNNACFKKNSNKMINEFVENGLNENCGGGGGGSSSSGGDTEKIKVAAKIREMRHSDNYRRDAWPILKREQIHLGSNNSSSINSNSGSNNNISSNNNNNNEIKTDNNNKIRNLNSRRVSDDYLIKITKRQRLNDNKSPSPPILVPDNNNKNQFIKSSTKNKLKMLMNNNNNTEDNVSSGLLSTSSSSSSSSSSMANIKQQQQKLSLIKHQQQQQQQQQRNKEKIIREEDKIIVKCPTEKEFKQYLAVNRLTDPIKKIIIPVQTTTTTTGTATTHQQSSIINSSTTSSSLNKNNNNSVESTSSSPAAGAAVLIPLSTSSDNNNVGGNQNGKRITLMQRLAENKKRNKQESLLKKN